MDDSPSKRKRPESMIQEPEGALKRQNAEAAPVQQSQSSAPPWYAAFPEPTLMVDAFPRQRALMVLSMKIASMLIVDVRREDYQGGAIRGSLNIPAQGFWWNRGMLYELAYKADVEWVVFICGSSSGRGPRCAAWFLEHVRNTAGDTNMNVSVLEGGIKGWVKSGPQFIQFMDGFVEEHWANLFDEEERAKQAQSGALPAGQDTNMS